MRSKFALITVVATALISLFAVQNAAASYTSVIVSAGKSGVCRTAPDVVSYRLAFSANVVSVGVAKPKKVRVGFQVVDRDTKKSIKSGVVYLKRSKGYKAQSKRFSATAGEKLAYHINLSYSVGGSKSKKFKDTLNDVVPSVAEMDALGIPDC